MTDKDFFERMRKINRRDRIIYVIMISFLFIIINLFIFAFENVTVDVIVLTVNVSEVGGNDMGRFIARQPNGRLCEFSTIVDTITMYNMTDEDYLNLCALKGIEKGKEEIENHIRPFEEVSENFIPNNTTQEEFDSIMKEMCSTVSSEVETDIIGIDKIKKIPVDCVSPIYSSIPVVMSNTEGISSGDIYGNIYNGDGKKIGNITYADNDDIYGFVFHQSDLYVGNTNFYISIEEREGGK